MLKATTEEQRRHIEDILRAYISWPLDFESEEGVNAIYFDGNITFDQMAAVVDFLRACNPEKK